MLSPLFPLYSSLYQETGKLLYGENPSVRAGMEIPFSDGIVKKVTMYVLIFVGFGIDCMISYVTSTLHIDMVLPLLFSAIIASWLVINELISITENCEKIGVEIPLLAPVLRFIRKKIESTVDVEEE